MTPLLDRQFNAAVLAHTRTELRDRAAREGLADQALFNFVVAANEIMTNAIRYAGGGGRLKLWRSNNDLWCEVLDRGGGIPRRFRRNQLPPKLPGRLTGCGIWLARQMSNGLEIHNNWFRGARVRLRFTLAAAAQTEEEAA